MPLENSLHSYDGTSDGYDKSHRRWLRFAGGEAQCAFEGAVTALLRPDVRALDVACGTGTVARRLLRGAEGLVELVLLDNSQKMLDKCRDIPAERVKGCMKSLPFAADRFDLLACAWGIETLTDPVPALQEFVRVTQPGGHICLVYCADRPARSVFGSALRHHIAATGRGKFLRHEKLANCALTAGAKRIQFLHCNGPAGAMILHV
jgi:ubiquinone/menaquinone biosynthesis C-methylase UbiE